MKFASNPDVLEALVLGRRSLSGHSGEEVVAVLVPALEAIKERHGGAEAGFVKALMKDAVHAVNKQLPQYMKIVDFYLREAEFEKTSTRKIRRFLYKDYANPKR
jgi:long-chain acyl-CoA synthetase